MKRILFLLLPVFVFAVNVASAQTVYESTGRKIQATIFSNASLETVWRLAFIGIHSADIRIAGIAMSYFFFVTDYVERGDSVGIVELRYNSTYNMVFVHGS